MYCSQCGKKVLDEMLFCPFCGAKIIIPEQDEAQAVPAPEVKAIEPEREERFTFEVPEEEAPAVEPARAPKPAAAAPAVPKAEEPPSVKNMFMDDEEDDYDTFERSRRSMRASYGSRYAESDDDDDEDEYEEGFFARHWKGLLVLVLVLALVAGGAFYAMSDAGQARLAKLNYTLPFIKSEVYGKLGYEAYQAGSYEEAGAYYERALARDPGSFNYAQSAAMAYMATDRTSKASDMLRKCVKIDPAAVDPYVSLLKLYPDSAARPAEIARLIEQGYTLTGDARLAPN